MCVVSLVAAQILLHQYTQNSSSFVLSENKNTNKQTEETKSLLC